MRARSLSMPLLGLWLLCGCGGGGRLLILLDRPTDTLLNPLDDKRLTKFSLRISQNGQTTDQEAFRGPNDLAELVVGSVPTGEPFDLRLAAKSAADEMLGLGFVRDVQAAETGESSVKVYFRKPVGYIGGQNRVVPLNTAAGAVEAPEIKPEGITLSGVSRVTDVATTPNGAWVLVAADSAILPVLTSNHSVLERVAFKAPVTCIAVSPDSRYAVVCHKTAVSVVELARVGTPEVPYKTVEVKGGEPTRIAFSTDRRTAHVLVNGMSPLGTCPGTPSLLGTLDVDAPAIVSPANLQQAVADIAVDPRDGGLLLALPCTGALARLQNNLVEVKQTGLPAPYDIAIAEKSFLVAGRFAGAEDRIQVVRFDLTKPDFNKVDDRNLSFPPLEVRFRDLSAGTGFFSWISEPSTIRIHHLAVSPDARRAVALFQADYSSNISLTPCTFRAQSQAAGYLILDLAANAIVLFRVTRLRIDDCYANCLINPQKQPLDNLQRCTDEYKRVLQGGQVLVPSEFEPASSVLLFGG